MNKIRRFLLTLFYFSTALLLSSCNMSLLNPKGMIAADEKHILIISVLLMLIVVIPTMLLSYIFAWRYRESNKNATYSPDWTHSTIIEVICWTIPCIIIAILGTITWISSHTLDPYKPIASKEKPLVIQAVALNWKWLFIYPEQHIATINYVQIPVGTPVQFQITGEGPMNSLQIPQLGGQIYAMAGMRTKLHLIADEAGTYQGFSANFSGEGFSDMRFVVKAGTKNEFKQWVTAAHKSKQKLDMAEYKKLAQPSINNPVQYFSSTNNDVFDNVIMKSMMPMETVADVSH